MAITITQVKSNVSGIPAYSSDTVLNVTAGELISKHQFVYLNADGKAYIADNTTLTEPTRLLGAALAAAASGATFQVKRMGILQWDSTLTAGAVYYLSTAGAITSTVPTSGKIIIVGMTYKQSQAQI